MRERSDAPPEIVQTQVTTPEQARNQPESRKQQQLSRFVRRPGTFLGAALNQNRLILSPDQPESPGNKPRDRPPYSGEKFQAMANLMTWDPFFLDCPETFPRTRPAPKTHLN